MNLNVNLKMLLINSLFWKKFEVKVFSANTASINVWYKERNKDSTGYNSFPNGWGEDSISFKILLLSAIAKKLVGSVDNNFVENKPFWTTGAIVSLAFAKGFICFNRRSPNGSNQTNFESSFRCLEKLCKKTENLVLINEKSKSSLRHFVDEMFVKELKERFDLERLSNIWIDLKRIVLLISSMFVIYEKKFLSPLTIKDVVFEIVRNKIHENDDIINNVCYGISNFFYSQRKAMIEKDEDYLIKFDLIKEFKEILIVFDI